ncbi:hypothetical protein D3C77_568520 [compost metagenome]
MFGAGTGHAHDLFRFLVEGFEFVIAERPVHTDAVQAVHPHVVGHIAPGVRRPVPGGAADHTDVFRRVGVRTGLHQIAVVFRPVHRMRRPFGEGIRRHPVATAGGVAEIGENLRARNARAGFQHQHRCPLPGQATRRQRADDP